MACPAIRSGLSLLIFSGSVGAVPPSARGDEVGTTAALHIHQTESAWLEPYDPTLLSRRLLTEFEYEDHEDGKANAKWKWSLRWAVPLAKHLAFGLQMEAPLRWAEEAGEDDAGFGDLETRAGLIGQWTEKSRWALGMNAKFPTASSDILGDGLIELRPIAAVRWEATDRLELGANAEYNFTPRDEGDDRVSALELKVPVVIKLAEKLSGFASYNPRWNDVQSSWRHRLELGLTRLFGSHNDYALSIGAEVPLTDEVFQWKGNLGFTWYLK